MPRNNDYKHLNITGFLLGFFSVRSRDLFPQNQFEDLLLYYFITDKTQKAKSSNTVCLVCIIESAKHYTMYILYKVSTKNGLVRFRINSLLMTMCLPDMWCFCFVCLRLVFTLLPVSLDYPFLIAPSLFSNVYLSCVLCTLCCQFLWIVHF